MQVSYAQVLEEDDVIKMLFSHSDSVKAARTFVDWLKSKDGICTHSDMSEFSHRLASGKLKSHLSRTNFYKTILHHFLDLGLIAEMPSYDYERHKVVKIYRAIIQPIGKRRPLGPSFILLAHQICEKWNEEFTEKRHQGA